MQFKDGAKVLTTDGDQVGTIDRVVLKPATMEVTHVVVRKGFFFTEDKVVPVSMIGPTTEESLTLRPDAGDLDELPDYRETDYIEVDGKPQSTSDLAVGNGEVRPVFYYPPVGGGWLFRYDAEQSGPRYVTATKLNIPDDAVALEEGARVVASDGEHVGDIERIFTGPISNEATHFIIAQGLIMKERRLIPTEWLSLVAEDEVRLSVDSRFVERLPEYELQD